MVDGSIIRTEGLRARLDRTMQVTSTTPTQHLRVIAVLVIVTIIAFAVATLLPAPAALMTMLMALLTVYVAGLIYVRRVLGR